MMTLGIDELARRLLREGYADNESDARLAAVLILLESEAAVEMPDADAQDDSTSRKRGGPPNTGEKRRPATAS